MILLDTNVISEWMRPSPAPSVIAWLDRQSAADLYLPSIGKAEIEAGIMRLPEGKRRDGLRRAAETLFTEFSDRCLSLDCEAATEYGEVIAVAKSLGRPISVEDALIAAITNRHGCTLATRNVKDFDYLPGLKLINPWSCS